MQHSQRQPYHTCTRAWMCRCRPFQGCVLCRGAAVPRLAPAEVEAAYGRLPAQLRTSLMPFQRAGVRYGLARQGRILLADEMGVGKTVQAIALAACYEVRVHGIPLALVHTQGEAKAGLASHSSNQQISWLAREAQCTVRAWPGRAAPCWQKIWLLRLQPATRCVTQVRDKAQPALLAAQGPVRWAAGQAF